MAHTDAADPTTIDQSEDTDRKVDSGGGYGGRGGSSQHAVACSIFGHAIYFSLRCSVVFKDQRNRPGYQPLCPVFMPLVTETLMCRLTLLYAN